MSDWPRSDVIGLVGITISAVIAIVLFVLQRRLSDRQKIDNRLRIEETLGKKFYEINYKDHSRKIHLYNVKLLNKKYFSENKRNIIWGYPYHAAELYAANFDGMEFVIGIENIEGKKHYKVGVIPYERILAIRPEGDGSFNSMIIYVSPRLVQKDRYSIAYKSFRYYTIK
jgi:hypothetical protein